MGKTRLAIEYALRHAEEYSALLFAGAGSRADLPRDLAALCHPHVLNLPKHAAREEDLRVGAALL